MKERGYDTVRIDAYPHLLAADPIGQWTLKPEWNQQTWGAPGIIRLCNLQGNLIEFLALCRQRGILVGLSSWYREDLDNTRMKLAVPEDLARIWVRVLDVVAEAGLMGTVLYVDLCNEYPRDSWAKFLRNDPAAPRTDKEFSRSSEVAVRWMNRAIDLVRAKYPDMDYTFSQDGEYDSTESQDVSRLDFLEPHLWMTSCTDFCRRIDFRYDRFAPDSFQRLALHGKETYEEQPEVWDDCLRKGVANLAQWSRRTGKPLITTECWSLVDFKDGPMLEWDWIKHLCEVGVTQAVSEGCWAAIATSNFCGPQFVGMWRDIAWHQRLTQMIKNGNFTQPAE